MKHCSENFSVTQNVKLLIVPFYLETEENHSQVPNVFQHLQIFHVTCCVEWYERRLNKSVEWEGRLGMASALPFDGVPYIVLGRMVFACTAGHPRSGKPTSLACFTSMWY